MVSHRTWSAPISITKAVPWNSIELGVRQFRLQKQFYRISWNLQCANFDGTSSFRGFHGTWGAPISLTRAVPVNSKEFLGTWNAPISLTRAFPGNSMEHGVRQFRWNEQFHGSWSAPILFIHIQTHIYSYMYLCISMIIYYCHLL